MSTRFGQALKIASVVSSVGAGLYFLSLSRQSSPRNSKPQMVIEGRPLKLHSVIVSFRHGARTPLYSFPGAREIEWEESLTHHAEPHAININVNGPNNTPRPPSDHDRHQMRAVFPGGASKGQLTSHGRLDANALGQRLRKRYIEDVALISKQYIPSEVYVRSTNLARTIESARSVLQGMFGKTGDVIPILALPSSLETMYPNLERCPRLAELFKAGKKFHYSADERSMATIRQLAALLKVKEADIDFVGLRDVIVSRQAHGKNVPDVFNDETISQIDSFATLEIKRMITHSSSESLKLGIGPFLKDLLVVINNVTSTSNQGAATRLHLFSCHDTTLIPILEALETFDNKWPDFAASITFEILQSTSIPNQFFVRSLYNDQPLVIPACKGTLCSLEQFKGIFQRYISADLEKDCKPTSKNFTPADNPAVSAEKK